MDPGVEAAPLTMPLPYVRIERAGRVYHLYPGRPYKSLTSAYQTFDFQGVEVLNSGQLAELAELYERARDWALEHDASWEILTVADEGFTVGGPGRDGTLLVPWETLRV